MTPREMIIELLRLPPECLDKPMMVQAGERYCGPVLSIGELKTTEWGLIGEDDEYTVLADDTEGAIREFKLLLCEDPAVEASELKVLCEKHTVFIEAQE